jgi:DNA-binding Lrp family transcriptional regulator
MIATDNALVAFLRDFRANHAYGPTYREIASELRISFQAVHQRVELLKRAGKVRHEPSIARSLDIIQVAEAENLSTIQEDDQSGTGYAVASQP